MDERDNFWWFERQLGDTAQVIRRLVATLESSVGSDWCAMGELAAAGFVRPAFGKRVRFRLDANLRATVTRLLPADIAAESHASSLSLTHEESKVVATLEFGRVPSPNQLRNIWGLKVRTPQPEAVLQDLLERLPVEAGFPKGVAGLNIRLIVLAFPELREQVPEGARQWLAAASSEPKPVLPDPKPSVFLNQ